MSNRGRKRGQTQSKKFIDKARELGVDEDEAAFDEKLKRLAKTKPKKKAPFNESRSETS